MCKPLASFAGVALTAALVLTRPALGQDAPPPEAPPPEVPPQATFAQESVAPRPVSFDVFYNELSPYGAWVQCEPYGWVWLPADVDTSWEPYTSGYWGYAADWGYVWYPDEVWGWAPFHYGNWLYTPAYGWAWVPGYTWGAAWVSWRFGAGYVGWAPLPPRYYYGQRHDTHQPDVRNDVVSTINPKHFVVVPESSFANTHVTSVMRRPADVGGTFEHMPMVDRLPRLAAQRNAAQPMAGRIDSPGARDIARIDQTSPRQVPRYSATPRVSPSSRPQSGAAPNTNQIRALPPSSPAMPRSMPMVQPRISPSGPVMRAPAPRAMPSGGGRIHMPSGGRHR